MGIIEIRLKFHQVSRTFFFQCKLMYLTRAHEENEIVTDFVGSEVYNMITISLFQRKNEKEIMPVKSLNHILSSKQRLNISYTKAFGKIRLALGCLNMPYRNGLHCRLSSL